MKSDERILFSRIRNIALSHGKHPKFKAWLKAQQPDKELHHVCGSVMGRKSTDLFAVMVTPQEHREKQDDIDWCISQIPEAIGNLMKYIEQHEI